MDTSKSNKKELKDYCNECKFHDEYSFEPCYSCIENIDFCNFKKPKYFKKRESL